MTATFGEIITAFERQSVFCREKHAATLTAAIIDAACADIKAGGPLASYVENFGADPWKDALALRIAGAIQYLVIKGHAPALRPIYAGDKKIPDTATLQQLISAIAVSEQKTIQRFIDKPPQTNEIKRAAALLPGFAMIAAETGLPLDLYELGASGGLLLTFDKFKIDYGTFSWGNGDVALKSMWRGPVLDLSAPINIDIRLGCDHNPIDFLDEDQIDMMHSYIWPEQAARHALFDAAIEKRLAADVNVEKADALDWVEEKLGRLQPAKASVIFHSVFAVYLGEQKGCELDAIIEAAGAKATTDSPLARLSFEPVETGETLRFMVQVQIWPGGSLRTIASAHAHGEWVEPCAI